MKEKSIFGYFPLKLILYPLAWWARKPFRLHEKGQVFLALVYYRRWIKSKHIPEKNKGLYYFNAGLACKDMFGKCKSAESFFEKARSLGITENPDNHKGDKPFFPKHN
ncbi:hypothetical protein A2303_07545 [Candidatus Falkowbacteria bacterium RIFOXYB2_FULL_47_14]|uniref:Uncharacterized protein n=1 Tax=Candidatus Falkowbacteria bacterium RIFOXYA2_FULL_47_19 TaxID=1797994 RepID=A0A1F5SGG8_9BACT|nr:MAG: hypothetical protein A2227_01295 [Candidatus Falkowbacteria bacterium RIFOXYA2_FULL_47_19]OGF34997.1 MAG: hypothetical protein A2468_07250 [Candidatus Falkowbacteria bacterium RIFOXYC2_FULL_46_15]OGF43713.1 MAG: hypothetical protein A2303_07545 [Candidatus Falkowbacteria bacterium RIFOXYB2_FULL_47_14]